MCKLHYKVKKSLLMNKKYSNQRVLITGANGFIGTNLIVRLNELANITVCKFIRGDDIGLLDHLVTSSDAVIHLAGENRPLEEVAFEKVNVNLTSELCKAIEKNFRSTGRRIPLILASSIQAELDTPYGRSKLAAEEILQSLNRSIGNPCIVFRLPGVFGKWCKPNYNSVVATFCNNLAKGIPIQINDADTSLRLVYIDDVIDALLGAINIRLQKYVHSKIAPEYTITLGELAKQIRDFSECRTSLLSARVGSGLTRALYATYISYLPKEKFSYVLSKHTDSRGDFVEMLKTPDCGQFSYFTAHPGITRGGHYHHTKTEKFLVIKGEALFRFRHLLSEEVLEIYTCESTPTVVDTIPGWTHDITNVGSNEMVVMLWASENYEISKPDTVACKVTK